jgi:hypothetical protein
MTDPRYYVNDDMDGRGWIMDSTLPAAGGDFETAEGFDAPVLHPDEICAQLNAGLASAGQITDARRALRRLEGLIPNDSERLYLMTASELAELADLAHSVAGPLFAAAAARLKEQS